MANDLTVQEAIDATTACYDFVKGKTGVEPVNTMSYEQVMTDLNALGGSGISEDYRDILRRDLPGKLEAWRKGLKRDFQLKTNDQCNIRLKRAIHDLKMRFSRPLRVVPESAYGTVPFN